MAKYEFTTSMGLRSLVEADYLKLENGHLIFRNEVRPSYPKIVLVVAPGEWSQCRLIEEKSGLVQHPGVSSDMLRT